MTVYKDSKTKLWRFRCSYKTKEGIRKQKNSKGFPTKKEARAAEIEFLKGYDHPNTPPLTKNTIIFKDYHAQWIVKSSIENEFSTIDDKKRILWVNFSGIMERPIQEITYTEILEYMKAPEFLKLSTGRKNKIHMHLKSVFKLAKEDGLISDNPMDRVPRFRETYEEKVREVEIYSIEQFNKLLEYIPYAETRNLFFWLYWTGMRLNEAKSLVFADIDTKKRKAKIYRQYDHRTKKWKLLKTKGSKRTIDLDSDLLDVFYEQLEKYKKEPGFDPETYFIFGGSQHLPNTTLQRHKNRAVKESGLPQVKIHSFRHSHASNLIEAGISLFKISKRLGHSSVTITADVYGHLVNEQDDMILNAMRHKK